MLHEILLLYNTCEDSFQNFVDAKQSRRSYEEGIQSYDWQEIGLALSWYVILIG